MREIDTHMYATSDFRLRLDEAGLLDGLGAEQRDWLLYRAMREFGLQLESLASQRRGLTRGAPRPAIAGRLERAAPRLDDRELVIADQEVMQAWEEPLMRAMADVVTRGHGDVLEVGFGMGLSASHIVGAGVRSYTVIEANPGVADRFARWAAAFPATPTRLVPGRWQDVLAGLGAYDGIFFDAYPADERDWFDNALNACTYAEHFFAAAAAHLRPGGVFTYYTGELDSLSNAHQRALLACFASVEVSVVRGLAPPDDCTYWWAPTMAVVAARR